MSSATIAPQIPRQLEDAVAKLDASVLSPGRRRALLARAFELRSGREKPNRYWKIDLDALDYAGLSVDPQTAPGIETTEARGVIACDLRTAAGNHAELFGRAFGSAVDPSQSKFAALAAALCNTGAFVYVPADCAVETVQITYDAQGGLFPYTLIVLERGARCTVVERIRGVQGAFVAGIAEIVTGENATVTFASLQELPESGTALLTRAAKPGKDSSLTCSLAELGAALSVSSMDAIVEQPGVEAQINALFFPREEQHVDMISTVEHNVGASQSQTLVKSAATGRGQARFLGNIRIAAHAQATESSLRDDALLLSKRSHIDSVPALEIAANDVKAFHGATVGALDEDQIFYMTSRGIERENAEKMIALGFFEPVIERFPGKTLREALRSALQEKVSA